MGLILSYIVESSHNRITAFESNRCRVNEDALDSLTNNDEHKVEQSSFSKDIIAEDHPSDKKVHLIKDRLISDNFNRSPMKFFVDGSRRVYRGGDIVINGSVYPIVTGQIVIACCKREQREMMDFVFRRLFVVAVPELMDTARQGENFFRKKKDELNDRIKNSSLPVTIQCDAFLPYSIDGDKEIGHNKYLRKAITVIQNEMVDQEKIMVMDICKGQKLSDDSWLIKDGSLEYRKDFTNRLEPREDEDIYSARYARHMQNVIGVSKLFDPELLSDLEPRIGEIISKLEPFQRTNAYHYNHEGKHYCVWYLRL